MTQCFHKTHFNYGERSEDKDREGHVFQSQKIIVCVCLLHMCDVCMRQCQYVYVCLFFSFFSYICRTDPADVARVEAKTFICTEDKYETVPHVKEGVAGILGHWLSPEDMQTELNDRFPGCMAGKFIF